MVFQVDYDIPLPLAVSDLHPQAEQLAPGETITVTATVENVGADPATVTSTLTLLDVHGNTVGWQDGGSLVIPAGEQVEVSLEWSIFLDEGPYDLTLTLWRTGNAVGLATGKVNVVGGALTSLEVPTTTVAPGEQATFRVTFANYRTTPVTATAHLVIYDEDGIPIAEPSSQSSQVDAQDEATFSLTWNPGGVAGGTHTAQAVVEREDGVTYGPMTEAFRVGHGVYLPLVLRND